MTVLCFFNEVPGANIGWKTARYNYLVDPLVLRLSIYFKAQGLSSPICNRDSRGFRLAKFQ